MVNVKLYFWKVVCKTFLLWLQDVAPAWPPETRACQRLRAAAPLWGSRHEGTALHVLLLPCVAVKLRLQWYIVCNFVRHISDIIWLNVVKLTLFPRSPFWNQTSDQITGYSLEFLETNTCGTCPIWAHWSGWVKCGALSQKGTILCSSFSIIAAQTILIKQ